MYRSQEGLNRGPRTQVTFSLVRSRRSASQLGKGRNISMTSGTRKSDISVGNRSDMAQLPNRKAASLIFPSSVILHDSVGTIQHAIGKTRKTRRAFATTEKTLSSRRGCYYLLSASRGSYRVAFSCALLTAMHLRSDFGSRRLRPC